MSHILLELKKIENWFNTYGQNLEVSGINNFKDLILGGTKIDLKSTENSFQHPRGATIMEKLPINTEMLRI